MNSEEHWPRKIDIRLRCLSPRKWSRRDLVLTMSFTIRLLLIGGTRCRGNASQTDGDDFVIRIKRSHFFETGETKHNVPRPQLVHRRFQKDTTKMKVSDRKLMRRAIEVARKSKNLAG